VTLADVLESLAEECHVDHVGLWEIVDAVRFDLGSTNAPETRALTLRLVRSLLSERGMQVGHPAPDGRHFVSWDVPPDQAVSRIDKEWSALGREPNIGEVAWFTSAQKPSSKLLQTGPA
jgi:hypothetical protein